MLQIFTDAAIYTTTLSTENGKFTLPLDLNHVSAYNVESEPLQLQLLSSGRMMTYDPISVTDKYGNSIAGNLIDDENDVTLITNGKLVVIKKPITIISQQSDNLYRIIPSVDKIIIRGIHDKIKWYPIYTLQIADQDILAKINLDAIIQNHGSPLEANRVVLTKKNYFIGSGTVHPVKEERAMMASAQLKRAEPLETQIVSDDENKVHVLDQHIELTKKVNLPVWNRSVNLPRVYYYFMGDSYIYYGYEFESDDFLPAGKVKVYGNNYLAIKEFYFDGAVNNKVRFRIDQSQDMKVTSDINTNEQGVTEFTLNINSRKDHPVVLRIIQPVRNYKRIISQGSYIEDRDRGEVIWDVNINPGANTIADAFTIVRY